MTEFLETPSGRKIAYHRTEGTGVGVVFLGGFMSDMEGTKAVALEVWAKSQGRSFLRFDYSGHGQSSGEFQQGCIGDWAEDAQVAITQLTSGPQILVGSSMGGWISLLLTQRLPTDKIAGLIGIAAAPDFTEDSMFAGFSEDQLAELNSTGVVLLPSDYGAPYPITKRLIEDGRQNLVLRSPLPAPFPVRLLQGTQDTSVDRAVALKLLDHIDGDDLRLSFVKGADHSFSSPSCLTQIEAALSEVLSALEA
ncbi:pimeloyl-ACP methyl ester carboxylesterase [Pacificibacter maritimus]|uniref:Pimeloyl-ACP methyl ester carboxylesterase n=1 Tax=Pacificibacter maritimus TaxID=762213 RepID=A0A3N4VDI7_9RHOB|nr:alpha/beta hydrolase [Pacificibacter maritimus]RPE71004.1 pimeloyl-ACP methyl ester carboxylesterase [Pacificibacter maritimus]